MTSIVYFLPNVKGGVANVIRNLIKFNSKIISQRVVLYSDENFLEEDKISKEFFNVETYFYSFSKYNKTSINLEGLRKYILTEDEILFCNGGMELKMANYFKIKNKIAYMIHGDFNSYYEAINENYGVIDLIFSISNKITKTLYSSLKTFEKIAQVKYPVDLVKYELNINDSPNYLFVGSLDKRKGAHLLERIINEVIKKIPNAKIKVVGVGEFFPSLKGSFINIDNVEVMGWLENLEIQRLMCASDILIFPSFSEGLPNVIIEALNSRCIPVVWNIESGIQDLIVHKDNGLIIEVGCLDLYIENLIELGRNTDFQNHLKNNSEITIKEYKEPYLLSNIIFEKLENINSQNKVYTNIKLSGFLDMKLMPNKLVRYIRRKKNGRS